MRKKNIYIENRKISSKDKPFIIAEISANHKKSINLVFKILEAAAESGVDAVKFQTFLPNEITLNSSKKTFRSKITLITNLGITEHFIVYIKREVFLLNGTKEHLIKQKN